MLPSKIVGEINKGKILKIPRQRSPLSATTKIISSKINAKAVGKIDKGKILKIPIQGSSLSATTKIISSKIDAKIVGEFDKGKILKIPIQRFPLSDSTNIILSKINTSKWKGTKKNPKSSNNKSIQIDSSIMNGNNYFQNVEKKIEIQSQKETIRNKKNSKSKGLFKNKPNMNVDGKHNTSTINNKKLQKEVTYESVTRPSITLSDRLRKGTVKHYLESTLEESTNQCTPDKSKLKVPIYRQRIPILPKSNSKDPYALDIFDNNEINQKKKRSSAKFNKTMYSIMEEIEKQEKKINKKRKVTKIRPTYEDKIQNVIKNVLHRVHKYSTIDNKNNSNYITDLGATEISNNSDISSTRIEMEDGFHGFDDNDKILSINQLRILNSLNISVRSLPGSSKCSIKQNLNESPKVNIISNISLEPNQNYKLTNTTNRSQMNGTCKDIETNGMNETCKDIETNGMNTTSYVENIGKNQINPLDKSCNLHREFQGDILLLDEDSEFFDNYVEDKEYEDDEFFGFQDENNEEEIMKFERLPYKKKILPWRFQGYFKRNPHILKLKKNGLPCKQQEMVLDYEFVKRIEALCSTKSVDSSHIKDPVQKTILDYVESVHDYQNEPVHPSLFDYEEFNIAKVPRKVLGIIQDNKVISTPTKRLRDVIMSPNVSIIEPNNENEENIPLRSRQKSYQRKWDQKKENKDISNEDVLPSILENNDEASPDGNLHLFEDVDEDREADFSIKLPTIKYEQKKRRKRQLEGFEDGIDEKKSKKKKNMMSKAEEIQFNTWADKMNARFEEEDKHELTIE